jgi:hypothetical protein
MALTRKEVAGALDQRLLQPRIAGLDCLVPGPLERQPAPAVVVGRRRPHPDLGTGSLDVASRRQRRQEPLLYARRPLLQPSPSNLRPPPVGPANHQFDPVEIGPPISPSPFRGRGREPPRSGGRVRGRCSRRPQPHPRLLDRRPARRIELRIGRAMQLNPRPRDLRPLRRNRLVSSLGEGAQKSVLPRLREFPGHCPSSSSRVPCSCEGRSPVHQKRGISLMASLPL